MRREWEILILIECVEGEIDKASINENHRKTFGQVISFTLLIRDEGKMGFNLSFKFVIIGSGCLTTLYVNG